ncbi:MAG: BREX-3 system P-loop-containing protein BrxF [Chloroflexota bacterium]
MTRLSPTKLAELEELLPHVARQYHRLLLIVGPIGSGKTPLLKALYQQQHVPYLNVNLVLSQRLLDLTDKERPLRVRRLLADVIDEQAADIIALDNLELLFDPTLHQDPLVCLQGLSRNRTLVAAWGGNYESGVLTYAEPGHPEYRRYERPEALIVSTLLPGKSAP